MKNQVLFATFDASAFMKSLGLLAQLLSSESSIMKAVNAIEGIPVSEETRADIQAWKQGELDFSSLYRRALVRYGFLKEAV